MSQSSLTKTRSFHDCVFTPTPDRPGYCSRCHKKLLVDTGIADDGVPGAWAYCRTCNTFYCPVNHRHVLKQGTVRWKDGQTRNGPGKVANCLIGTCGPHFDRIELAAAVIMVTPRGSMADERMAPMAELATGSDLWGCQAKALRALHHFKLVVEPVWIAEDRAAAFEREIAAEKAFAARQRVEALAKAEAAAARRAAAEKSAPSLWAAYAASGEAWAAPAPSGAPSVEELLAVARDASPPSR